MMHHITYFGVEASGATVKEAKQAAGRIIESAMGKTYFPRIRVYRGHVLVVCDTPLHGAWYSIVDASEDGQKNSGCNSSDNLEDCYARGLAHLADTTWQESDGLSVPDFVPPNLRRQVRDSFAWALACRQARNEGVDIFAEENRDILFQRAAILKQAA